MEGAGGFAVLFLVAGFQEVVVAHHFRANEAFRQIGVNDASGFDTRDAFVDGPRPALVLAYREKDDPPHAVEQFAEHVIARKALHAQVGHERGPAFLVELCQFVLELRGR